MRAGYDFENAAMRILPVMTEMPEIPIRLILILTAVISILLPSLIFGRLREALNQADRRIQTQAWQLRQLVPSATPK